MHNTPVDAISVPDDPHRRKQQPISLDRPRTINDVRHENFKAIVDQYGASVVADRMGLSSTTFISQMVGKTKWREVKESTVRTCEKAFDLPHGSLDIDHKAQTLVPPERRQSPFQFQAVGGSMDPALVGQVFARVLEVCSETNTKMSVSCQGALCALVFSDALEHAGVVRDSYIRQLLAFIGCSR